MNGERIKSGLVATLDMTPYLSPADQADQRWGYAVPRSYFPQYSLGRAYLMDVSLCQFGRPVPFSPRDAFWMSPTSMSFAARHALGMSAGNMPLASCNPLGAQMCPMPIAGKPRLRVETHPVAITPGLFVAPLLHHVAAIIKISTRKQMRRITAGRIIAAMKHFQRARIHSEREIIRDTMHGIKPSAVFDLAVAALRVYVPPLPTVALRALSGFFIDTFPKPNGLLRRENGKFNVNSSHAVTPT